MSVPAQMMQQMSPPQGMGPVNEEPAENYRYTDSELCSLIDRTKSSSQMGESSQIDGQIRDAFEYYYGLRPHAPDTNVSDFVSMEVFDSVESTKAKLIKAFASNRNLVRFKPTSEHDVEQQELRTKFVNKIIQGNSGQGYRLLHDVFHDGLVSKLATVKRYYHERHVVVWKEFEDVPMEQLQAAAMREEVLAIEVSDERWQDVAVPTRMGPTKYRAKLMSGRISVREDHSKIELDAFPPECVSFGSNVTDLTEPNDLPGVVLSYCRPKYRLIEDGFDPQIVNELKGQGSPTGGASDARNQIDGTNAVPGDNYDDVYIDEGYFWLDMDSDEPDYQDGAASLWQIIKSDSTVIEKRRVSEIPLRFWSPFRISHKAVGLSMADVSMDSQAGTTAVTRGIIDNVHRVNAGVRIFNMSAIKNPLDVVDNPIGGIIDTDLPPDRVGSVAPQPALSPASMALLEVLASQKEQRTGETRLGRGLNTSDVIRNQNAASMIDQLIEVGNDRPMMMARGFAELFWRPLMMDVFRLAVENDVKLPLEVEGKTRMISARELPGTDDMEIDIALLPDYGDQQARKVLTAHQLLVANPVLAPLYGMEEQYAVISEVFHLMGMPNWLANPKDPKVIQRLQMAQKKKAEMEQMQKAMLAKKMQLEERAVVAQERKVGGDQKIDKEKLNLDAVQGAAEQNLDERQFQWQRAVDIAELRLEKEQQRAASIGDKQVPKRD